jgi:hypothetical protein
MSDERWTKKLAIMSSNVRGLSSALNSEYGLHLRSSIALNNHAVALFEDQKCLEAHFVLKETLSVLRRGLISKRGYDIQGFHSQSSESLALDSVSVVKSAKDKAAGAGATGFLRHDHLSPVPLQVVPDDSCELPPERVRFVSGGIDLTQSPFCLVRIEVHDSIDANDEDSVLATVALNYGVSFLCLARLSSSLQRITKLRESALKIFGISRGLLTSQPHLHLRTLLLGAILGRAVFRTLIQLGHVKQAKQILPSLGQCEMQFEACRLILTSADNNALNKAPAA